METVSTYYKRHPEHQHVSVRSDGKAIKYYGDTIFPKEHEPKTGNMLMVVFFDKLYFSLAKLVAETFLDSPKSDKRHYAICKDGDFKNTHPDNLEWTTTNASKESSQRFKNASKNSKLTQEQAVECHTAYTTKKSTLKELGVKYGVSDMSIHRAIKRVEKTLK